MALSAIRHTAAMAEGDFAEADESLMLRFAGGDVRAFERLYDRHERPMYRFLLRSVRIQAVADELLQEVGISVIRAAKSYQPQAAFTTWLYRVARSRLIDHWRARDPEVLESLDQTVRTECDATLLDLVAGDASQQPEVETMNRAQARAFVA